MAEGTDLARFTTMGVGGPAEFLREATSRDEIVAEARAMWAAQGEWFVLGGGSNTVVSDDGFPGEVLRIASRGVEERRDGEFVRLRVEAGENWDALVARTVDAGLAGLESLSGIPGSVGAAPIQNIGAYGGELADSLVSVEFLDAETEEVEELSAAELGLGYRTSIFKRGLRGIVLAVTLELRDLGGKSAPIRYAQLANALGVELGTAVDVRAVRERVLALRASKGMVLDADDPDTRSAGSFFTNPIVLNTYAITLPSEAPRWPVTGRDAELVVAETGVTANLVKLSAAWLIEHSGISRGFSLPGSQAAISSKHTLAITNRGGATAAEIAELSRYVQQRVSAEFGVLLHPEPVFVGDIGAA